MFLYNKGIQIPCKTIPPTHTRGYLGNKWRNKKIGGGLQLDPGKLIQQFILFTTGNFNGLAIRHDDITPIPLHIFHHMG